MRRPPRRNPDRISLPLKWIPDKLRVCFGGSFLHPTMFRHFFQKYEIYADKALTELLKRDILALPRNGKEPRKER